MKKKNMSAKVINRLTLYHCILDDFVGKNIEFVSSPQIASLLKMDDSQVRKDIALLNNTGKCRVGYDTAELKNAIEKTLGFSKTKDAFIVGAGNLGMALAKYSNFSNYGLNTLALFDNDPLKIGLKVNNREVFGIAKLPNLAQRLNVEIAILTVPKEFAQETCDFLVSSDIKYIWNFTPTVLHAPDAVQIWNENLMGNFLQFTYNSD
ncbi:MAG: redox-sensing transcriptional repressor Rex [Candidatus Gastranaerophilales bacterium]|nr:redox-sensing transcriptional repressor Rex [Candidatus Gastranaerophilales bacterium]